MELCDSILYSRMLVSGDISELDFIPDEEAFLKGINRFARGNVGLFCLSSDFIYNYERIIHYFELNKCKFMKDIIVAYTLVMDVNSLTDSEKEVFIQIYLSNFLNKHGIKKVESLNELIKIINVDYYTYDGFEKGALYYERENTKYIKYSFNYFISVDPLNKDVYEEYINLYRENEVVFEHKDNIVKFPKKMGFFRRLFKK